MFWGNCYCWFKAKMKMYANSPEKMKKQVAVVSNGENVGGVFCGMLAFT